MPMDRIIGSGAGSRPPARTLAALALSAALLGGCVGLGGAEGGFASRANQTPAGLARGGVDSPAEGGSALISDLQARRSVLPPGGAYARVADAVLKADSGTAAAELRIARLRSEARAKNWLPKLGPTVSLTSLNGLAVGLLLEQALFDHGRRKAERAYAAAEPDAAPQKGG